MADRESPPAAAKGNVVPMISYFPYPTGSATMSSAVSIRKLVCGFPEPRRSTANAHACLCGWQRDD